MSCFLQKSENISVHIQQVSLGDIVELAEKCSQKKLVSKLIYHIETSYFVYFAL